ncbi:MAG: hypothetical protein H5U02_10760 [Clostridia bacterium]|nr:hypothetical protein [Clostridia bacterium]
MTLTLAQRIQQMLESKNAVPEQCRMTVQEVLASPEAFAVIPQVISAVIKDAAERMYVASRMFRPVRITTGRSITVPAVGAVRAYDIPEGGEYPKEQVDLETGTEITVGKSGLVVQATEETVEDSLWNLIGISLQKAGRALGRLKEEKAFNLMVTKSQSVFDKGSNGQFNREDLLNLFLAVMANGFVPSDVLMHPLCWPIFVKNLGPLAVPGLATGVVAITPDAVQNCIPFPISIRLSPFAPFDRVTKTFDILVVDKNEVGINLIKEEIGLEDWTDPERDIRNIKVKECYGLGVLNKGRAIAVAKGIKFAST